MKEICHAGLSNLVGSYGAIPLTSWALKKLVNASVEPDQINEQRIAENIIDSLTVPIEWLVNHTIRAKALAVRCIWESYEAHRKREQSWPIYLGWALHFIADWGTPYHSPTSRANPVPALTGVGAIIGGIIGGAAESGNDLWDVIKGIAKGALVGAAITGVAGLIGLAIGHSDFESQCDNYWEKNVNLIEERFKTIQKYQHPPKLLNQALEIFEDMMNNLRDYVNNLPDDWIINCDKFEFADYMVQIALVMDFACQIIMR